MASNVHDALAPRAVSVRAKFGFKRTQVMASVIMRLPAHEQLRSAVIRQVLDTGPGAPK